METSQEVAIELQVLLQKQLDSFEDQPTILYNQEARWGERISKYTLL